MMIAPRSQGANPTTTLRGVMILACVVLASGSALSAPEVLESIERYEIRGSTKRELKDQMKHLGPGGRRYYGHTRWELTWTYTVDRDDDGRCTLGSFDVAVEVTTTLPRWDRTAGSAALVERWDRFLSALESHESAHRGYGVRAASSIESRVGKIAPRATCDELERTIDETARQIVERFRALERRFDEDTKHGRSDGARL